ncbi:hypothetical protein Mal15_37550 [Stieleria maiorica]|uniref:Uncharacterized protein n=1 Tax=Stieleria maiorica TaxID=2795974 RepID=A0A5B9MGR2_9BACT|nr:hypothetical protein Mal15_37550 [Stieleria maiorica]
MPRIGTTFLKEFPPSTLLQPADKETTRIFSLASYPSPLCNAPSRFRFRSEYLESPDGLRKPSGLFSLVRGALGRQGQNDGKPPV